MRFGKFANWLLDANERAKFTSLGKVVPYLCNNFFLLVVPVGPVLGKTNLFVRWEIEVGGHNIGMPGMLATASSKFTCLYAKCYLRNLHGTLVKVYAI